MQVNGVTRSATETGNRAVDDSVSEPAAGVTAAGWGFKMLGCRVPLVVEMVSTADDMSFIKSPNPAMTTESWRAHTKNGQER